MAAVAGPADVVVVGSGAVGAATAYYCALAGLRVLVLDRGAPGSGTSSRCEGNLLVSDKEHGPELDLADYSLGLWRGELAEFARLWEFEHKGGIIVASRESSMVSLQRALSVQREHGIRVSEIDAAALRELEPQITGEALGAAYYPDDCQVMPMLLTTHLLRMAAERGALVRGHTEVTGFLRAGDRVIGVRTPGGDIHAGAVVNAAGPWSAALAALAGVEVPVEPRRGYVLVTEPLPSGRGPDGTLRPGVFHKVYAAEYIDDVGSSAEGLQASPVVESTRAGSILVGSSRERVGFDTVVNPRALELIASNAVALFPFLRDVRILRHYSGFRPYSPDHVPVLGEDPRAPGLWHATGHEGAGIGLSVGTGKLIAQALTEGSTDLDLAPFSPARFAEVAA